ncbi:MAG TPA: DMT family transporter [Actinomycetota bacterium]|nr:DMT family transporter [Actinomycetota bacterium]
MKPFDVLRLVLLAAIWGSSFVLIKVGLYDLTVTQIVGIRLVVGALVLVALMKAGGLKFPERSVWPPLLLMAVLANITPFGLIAWGEERITSSLTAILNATTPLFTALFAALFLPGERMNLLRALGLAVGFAGVAVIVGVDTSGELLGQLAIVLAALTYGIGFVFSRRFVSGRAEPLSLSAAQISIGALIMIPVTAVDMTLDKPVIALDSMIATVALGALGTGVAFVLFYRLIADVGATSASMAIYLLPVFGVIFGRIFLGESIGANALAGAVLVIGGIAISERGARAANVPAPEGAPTPRR